MINYCYHTHTSRCGHAIGEDEEYVLHAIKLGIKRLGFSDHIFLPNFVQKGIRGNYEQLDEYLSSINHLKEKYKDQIDIIVGFEAEYFPTYLSYYKFLLDSHRIDYLILGQHFHQGREGLEYFPNNNPTTYVGDIISGLYSKLFTYVAHPDIYLLWCKSWDEKSIEGARRILKACEDTRTPIEINIGGMRVNRPYPSKEFFELSKEYNVEYVIGVDAHRPQDFNKEDIDKALKFMEEVGITIKDLVISRQS